MHADYVTLHYVIISIITVYSSDHVDPFNTIRTITKEKKKKEKNRTVA